MSTIPESEPRETNPENVPPLDEVRIEVLEPCPKCEKYECFCEVDERQYEYQHPEQL